MNPKLPSSDPVPWVGQAAEKPRVLLLGAGDRQPIRQRAEQLRPVIEQHAQVVLSDYDCCHDLASVEADFAIVMGGDGSILRAANQMEHRQLPVLGVNLGKLGFLADIDPAELEAVLPEVCAGHCRIVEHLMFECVVKRGEEIAHRRLGLNETAILGGPPYSILTVDLYIDAELATPYSCDGLIVSTPVGSTAHNLSAGGPILRKSLQAFVISPISPHTLTMRPVVDSADHTFEMRVSEPHDATAVVVDGQVLCRLKGDEQVFVRRSSASFKSIEARGHTYYRTLREKLGWGGDLRARDGR